MPAPPPAAPLSVTRKRLLIAQLAEINLLDCFDESGAFDIDRARSALPAFAVQEMTVDEVERTDRAGNTTVRRKIRVRLIDKLRAVKLDTALANTPDLEKTLEEQTAKADHATRRAQHLNSSLDNLKKHIDKEVASSCWSAIQSCLRDERNMPLPGIPNETFQAIVSKATSLQPRPPPQ
jgi:hypothetical protein